MSELQFYSERAPLPPKHKPGLIVYKNTQNSDPVRALPISHAYTVIGRETILNNHSSDAVLVNDSEVGSIYISDISVSRIHAAIFYSDASYFITDMSMHGTFVNDKKIEKSERIAISHNDKLRFGTSSTVYAFLVDVESVRLVPKRVRGQQSAGDKRHKEDVVAAKHILVKHKDSRKPRSWKSEKITRTLEEARTMIVDLKRRIESGEENWDDVAYKMSDCSSHRRFGDLGEFAFKTMQAPFSKAAFEMGVGDMKGPVETDSGVHLIYRYK